jgi:hypothetical protein
VAEHVNPTCSNRAESEGGCVTSSEVCQWMADECVRLAHQNIAERAQLLKAAELWANFAEKARLAGIKNEPPLPFATEISSN